MLFFIRETDMDAQFIFPSKIRTALFVDFDNIYIRLEEQDAEVAAQFACNPDRWLAWLEELLPDPVLDPSSFQRRILIRRCYLNPQSFSSYRPYFIRSAFEVIDCPPLTTRGKTSTDIHLVMDVLDALNHTVHFDEFIILSGDADFTPLLLRLRMHDRFTTILSAGYVSPAYKASCDYIIPTEKFIREALGISYSEEEAVAQIPLNNLSAETKSLLQKMADRLFEVTKNPLGVQASELPDVYKQFAEFRQSSRWLGFNTLRNLTESLVAQRDDLVIVEEDPWLVKRVAQIETISTELPSPSARREKPEDFDKAISEFIKKEVFNSRAAVKMEVLAQSIHRQYRDVISETNWLGAGTFKNLLGRLDLGRIKISPTSPPFIYDPTHHEVPRSAYENPAPLEKNLTLQKKDKFSRQYPDIAPLAWKIHQFTDMPYLLPEHYALLFQEVAREVNERGYQLTRTTKTVRDRCVEKGAPVSRAHVKFILINLKDLGHWFGSEKETPAALGEIVVKHTINLCRTAQLELSKDEIAKVHDWIIGSLA
jgi:uncharacterized LabA/DUF88 family protein